jgi:hypothetical protein
MPSNCYSADFTGALILVITLKKKLEKLKAKKPCDILFSSFQGISGNICYENQHIKRLKS